MTMWLLILLVYVAPTDAVNWNGPWKLGKAEVIGNDFKDEDACLRGGRMIQTILAEDMRAPVRYKCIQVKDTIN